MVLACPWRTPPPSLQETKMRTRILALTAALALVVPQDERQDAPVLPEVGKPAPAFQLNDSTGAAVGIGPGQQEAWTVLAYFPKAATPG